MNFPQSTDPRMMEAEVSDEPQMDTHAQEALRAEKLQAFGHSMGKQRDEWIRDRYAYGVDKRWLEDEDQYNAKDNVNKAASQMMSSVEQGYPVTTHSAKPHRSTVYIGLTRQKTNSAEARLSDMLLPTDDRNWGIQPSPDPELMGMAKKQAPALDPATGQAMTNQHGHAVMLGDIGTALMDQARSKAEAMERKIDDQLIVSDYNGQLRKVIHDAAKLGTGVIKGPVVTNRVRKAWQPYTDQQGQTVQMIEMVTETNPCSFRVDPRNCYPDPGCGESIHDGKGLYEMRKLTAKQVRELAKQPGYMKDQLRKVLEEGPQRSASFQEMKDEEQRDLARDTYELWEYWGEVEHEDLAAAQVNPGEKDELKTISACVIMINNTVVKAFLNPLEDGSLPYDFYVWEKVSGSCFGYGIPYLMRAQQKVLNAAWRQMMDNAGVSSGPQIVMKPSAIQPADKQWQLSSRKIWFATDDMVDVRNAFATFEFNSHQVELAAIIKMAMDLSDQESGVPAVVQGEKGNSPETVGGMQMLINSANVVLRRLVKQFDDMITRPHINRYYDYNMLYDDDEAIKGDFQIDARGSSSLLVRDIQNQAFLNLLAAGANPIYGVYLDTEKLFKKALQAQHIDPTDVFKSDEEIEKIKEAQKQPQQNAVDPRVQAGQLRAEMELKKAEMVNQGELADIEARKQMSQQDAEFRMQELQMQREIAMLKLSTDQHLSLEQIKAQLANTAIKERGKKELFAAEQRLKLAAGSGI